jgi:hypothetical protein
MESDPQLFSGKKYLLGKESMCINIFNLILGDFRRWVISKFEARANQNSWNDGQVFFSSQNFFNFFNPRVLASDNSSWCSRDFFFYCLESFGHGFC